MFDASFYKRLQDALGTTEEGEALIKVATDAHKVEQQLSTVNRKLLYLYGYGIQRLLMEGD